MTIDLADREIRTERLLLRRYRKGDLDRLADGLLLGDVTIFLRSVEHRQVEVGYVFHPDAGGRGYATEATRAAPRGPLPRGRTPQGRLGRRAPLRHPRPRVVIPYLAPLRSISLWGSGPTG